VRKNSEGSNRGKAASESGQRVDGRQVGEGLAHPGGRVVVQFVAAAMPAKRRPTPTTAKYQPTRVGGTAGAPGTVIR